MRRDEIRLTLNVQLPPRPFWRAWWNDRGVLTIRFAGAIGAAHHEALRHFEDRFLPMTMTWRLAIVEASPPAADLDGLAHRTLMDYALGRGERAASAAVLLDALLEADLLAEASTISDAVAWASEAYPGASHGSHLARQIWIRKKR